MGLLSEYQANRSLLAMKTMTDYMATSPAWTGPRPPRFLIWKEDIPKRPQTLPRPIPPHVLDQLDPLLEQAEKAMKQTIAAKNTELRQKQREIDQLYGKLAARRLLVEHEMGP